MARRYRYRQAFPRNRPGRWLPGFCCTLPAACCLIWIALFGLVVLISMVTFLRHLF
ncbi:MAG TPA: hypothetical protein VI138_08245 [Candidatus Dormibacteraeota bacterium]